MTNTRIRRMAGFAAVALWPILLMLIALASRGRRSLLLDWLIAAALAAALSLGIGALSGTPISESLQSLASTGPPQVYVSVRLALATAVVATASPHLSRPLRRIGRGVLLLGAVSAIALDVTFALGAAAGFLVGLAAAAGAHLLLGSPGGQLSTSQVTDALTELGLKVSDVHPAPFRTPGVVLMTATDADGSSLLVKVFGRDAWDSQFLASLWLAAARRGERVRLGRSRRGQLEHEAVATLVAQRAGVPVLPEVAVGSTADGDAVLVTRLDGHRFAALNADEITDEHLESAWRAVLDLHAAGLSHGRIDGDRVLAAAGGRILLADLAEADLAPSPTDIATDRARLLVMTAARTGRERAVTAAVKGLGPDDLAAVLPYLQAAVLDRSTRKAVAKGDDSLKRLRAAAADAAGVQPPPLQKLRRVTPKSVIITVGGTLLALYLITKLAGVDFSAIAAELAAANWWWIAGALLLSPFVEAAYAVGTMGASIKPLRYGPVVMLQWAIQFIAVALPATAARLALDVRFFERFGLAAAGALAIGVIDSTSGLVVQVLLIALIALTALPGLTSPVPDASSTSGTTSTGPSMLMIVLVLAGALVVAAAVCWLIPATRKRIKTIIPKARATIAVQRASAQESLQVLRRPRNLTEMLTGNLAAQLIQAAILGLCLQAFGAEAHFSQLVLVNTLVSLFAGLMPVPGGVGVAEAGYTACLQAIGIPSAIAISTAITFRLVTFYLPPLWGSVSMAWLRRHQYV